MAVAKDVIIPMFGTRLVMYRVQAGLDQEELAAEIKRRSSQPMGRNRVSRFERQVAMPKTWELVELAKYFGVSTDALLGLTKFEEGIIPTPPKRPRKLPKRERRVAATQRHANAGE